MDAGDDQSLESAANGGRLNEMIAYCGLFCGDCVRYGSTLTESARTLLTELEKRKFSDYVEVKKKFDDAFKDYPIFVDVLKKIVELECKESCRKGGGCSAFDCQIVTCCVEKKQKGCWECEQLVACDKFDFLKSFHGETPKKNCVDLRENGFDDFELRKNSFYLWDEKSE